MSLASRSSSGTPLLSEAEYRALRDLIESTAAIHLGTAKKPLLVGRLAKRLRELGLDSFGAYHERAARDPEELTRLLDLVSTNETHFFREPQHFAFLETELLPQLAREHALGRRSAEIRVWSAACSTGEEPFTLAMLLLDHFPPDSGVRIEIHASDLSTRVLERARQATWPLLREGEIPERYLKKFMLRGVDSNEGKIRAAPELRSVVHFHHINLNDRSYALPGRFDLIFCRNVLIYFDRSAKLRTVGRLLERLAPEGHLFLGHAESLHGFPLAVVPVKPTVYRRVDRRDAR